MDEPQPAPVPGTAQPPPGWDLDDDALAHALSWLTRHHRRERTAASQLAQQPR